MRDYGRIVDKSIGTLHIHSADKIKALSFKLQLQVGTFFSLGVIKWSSVLICAYPQKSVICLWQYILF